MYLIFSREDRVLRAYRLSVRMAMATRRGEAMCCLINACGDGSAMGGTARLHRMALCLCIGAVRIFLFVFEGGVERGGGCVRLVVFYITYHQLPLFKCNHHYHYHDDYHYVIAAAAIIFSPLMFFIVLIFTLNH